MQMKFLLKQNSGIGLQGSIILSPPPLREENSRRKREGKKGENKGKEKKKGKGEKGGKGKKPIFKEEET